VIIGEHRGQKLHPGAADSFHPCLSAVTRSAATKEVPTIGILTLTSDDPLVKVLREGLREIGYVEGQNIVFEHRFVEGKVDRLPDLAAELVRLKVEVIVARSTPVVQAVRNATGTTPIVISVPDAVGSGLVVNDWSC
jgi:putative ABC transport system substrate-binding protein